MVSEKIERTRVPFDSGGVRLVGYLRYPADATGKVACVVMGHRFSGTRDRLVASAEGFAGAGFAVLTFDFYRDPARQRVLADQIGFLRTHLAVTGSKA